MLIIMAYNRKRYTVIITLEVLSVEPKRNTSQTFPYEHPDSYCDSNPVIIHNSMY